MLNYSAAGASTAAESAAIVSTTYRINSYNSSVSSNSFFSRSVRFLQDTTVKTATTAKLKNTFSS
jgi:intein-encoded DNA endonuclease-like protein